jgi:hypothetical protein
MKRAGVAEASLRPGEKVRVKIELQLRTIKRMPQFVRSCFKAPSVSYITDWWINSGGDGTPYTGRSPASVMRCMTRRWPW